MVQDIVDQISIAEVPSELTGRVKFAEFDLFKPNPIQADVYILRFILHDYDDDSCMTILRNLTKSMKETSRIIVVEGILATDASKSSSDRLLGYVAAQTLATFTGQD